MKMSNLLCLCLLSLPLSFQVNAQGVEGIEEQRKYVFPPTQAVQRLMEKGANIEGLTIKKHSIYDYMDIYLDTKDFDLYKNNLSLRIRRRVFEDGKKSYGIQIKSEMMNNGDTRMEIEEDEIDIYHVFHQGMKYKLQDVIDQILDRYLATYENNPDFSQDAVMQNSVGIVKSWLSYKLDAPIAPFQKLKHLNKSFKSLKTLAPVMVGRSIRTRAHIFIDRSETTTELENFKQSLRNASEVPEEIKGNDYVWTMEGSFDKATFHSLILTRPPHFINEFEVENKYLPHEGSKQLFSKLESGLTRDYQAVINLLSKYRQSAKVFYQLP